MGKDIIAGKHCKAFLREVLKSPPPKWAEYKSVRGITSDYARKDSTWVSYLGFLDSKVAAVDEKKKVINNDYILTWLNRGKNKSNSPLNSSARNSSIKNLINGKHESVSQEVADAILQHYKLSIRFADFENYESIGSQKKGIIESYLKSNKFDRELLSPITERGLVKPALHRRYRYFPMDTLSAHARKVINQLLGFNYEEDNVDQLRSCVEKFETTFDQAMGYAVLYEGKGQDSLVIEHLSNTPAFYRPTYTLEKNKHDKARRQELCRKLFLGVAYEKSNMDSKAKSFLLQILIEADPDDDKDIIRAAQYAFEVCKKKFASFPGWDEIGEVNFTRFLSKKLDSESQTNELHDKAICMHALLCMQENRELTTSKEDFFLKSLARQREYDLNGFIKTLIIRYQLSEMNLIRSKAKITQTDIELILANKEKMTIGTKTAILSAVARLIKNEKKLTQTYQALLNELNSIQQLTRDFSVDKHINSIGENGDE